MLQMFFPTKMGQVTILDSFVGNFSNHRIGLLNHRDVVKDGQTDRD